jgi:hypothetical protein
MYGGHIGKLGFGSWMHEKYSLSVLVQNEGYQKTGSDQLREQ